MGFVGRSCVGFSLDMTYIFFPWPTLKSYAAEKTRKSGSDVMWKTSNKSVPKDGWFFPLETMT